MASRFEEAWCPPSLPPSAPLGSAWDAVRVQQNPIPMRSSPAAASSTSAAKPRPPPGPPPAGLTDRGLPVPPEAVTPPPAVSSWAQMAGYLDSDRASPSAGRGELCSRREQPVASHPAVGRLSASHETDAESKAQQYLDKELRKAVDNRQLEHVKELLLQGASMHKPDRGGKVPLHLAAGAGEIEIAELLIGWNADVNKQDNEGREAAFEAYYWCVKGRSDEKYAALAEPCEAVLKLLLDHGGRIEDKAGQLKRLIEKTQVVPGFRPVENGPELQALENGTPGASAAAWPSPPSQPRGPRPPPCPQTPPTSTTYVPPCPQTPPPVKSTQAQGHVLAPGWLRYCSKFAYDGKEINENGEVVSGYVAFPRDSVIDVPQDLPPSPGDSYNRYTSYVYGACGNLQGWLPIEALLPCEWGI